MKNIDSDVTIHSRKTFTQTFYHKQKSIVMKGRQRSCRFASATSALKCTRFGAQQGIPGYEEVLEFMKTHEGVVYDG